MKTKKIFMLLAMNSLLTPLVSAEAKYEKLYNGMTNNLIKGRSNDTNYKLIEQTLKKRNKELKDLYLQSDYIVKPEYLSYQIFFSGFYNNSSRGGSKDFITTVADVEPKSINLGMVIPIKGLTKKSISLDLTLPSEPEINVHIPDINVAVPTAGEYEPVSVKAYSVSGLSMGIPNKNPGQNTEETGEETNTTAYNNNGSKMFENLNIESVSGTVVQMDSPSSLNMTGAVNYFNGGLNATTNVNETHTGQGASIAVLNTGINGNFTIKGDWILNANSAQDNTFAFLSYRPNYITGDSSVTFDGTLELNRGTGTRGNLIGLALNLKNSTASGTPTAILENKGDISITVTPNANLGRTIGMQLDPLDYPSLIKGELINSGKITVETPAAGAWNSQRATALLINSGSVSPTADIKIGNIDLKASSGSIGLEIGTGSTALTGVKIDGSTGVINALGNGSYAVTIGNAVMSDTVDNLIGGIKNLNIFLNGNNSNGIYLSDMPSDGNKNIILDDKVIQSMSSGDNAAYSTMFYNNSLTNNVIMDSSLADVTDFNKGMHKDIIVNTGKNLKNYMPVSIISSENAGGIAIINFGKNNDTTLENYGDIVINSECKTCTYLGAITTVVGLSNSGGSIKNFSNISLNATNANAVSSNSGTITLNNGDIAVNGDYGTALLSFYNYSGPKIQPVINLESGNVSLNGTYGYLFYIREGIIALGSQGNVINASVSGENSYLFSKSYNTEQYFSGKFHINGDVNSSVDKKSSAFYYDGAGYYGAYLLPPNDFSKDLSDLFVVNNGTLTIDVKDDAYLLGLTKMGLRVSDLEDIKISTINLTGSKKVKLTNSTIYIDTDSNLDYQNNTGKKGYRNLEYYDANIILNSGVTVTGTEKGQTAMKFTGDETPHLGENNGIIDLSGDKSIGIYVRDSQVTNNGLINLENSKNSTGIFGDLYKHQGDYMYYFTDTEIYNSGDIKIGENGIGIYANTKNHTNFGPDNIVMKVTNDGNIIGTGGYTTGIYLDNSTNSETLAGQLTLTSASNIDLSNSKNGIGVYTDTTDIGGTDSGRITVGENGVGIYIKNGTALLNNLTLNLYGDNSIGIYTDGTNSFTGNGTINVDGKGITLFNLLGSGNFDQNFNITAEAGSSYTLANIKNNTFYSNSSASLAENGIFINGVNSAVLLGSSSDLTSTDSNITGIALDGAYTGGIPVLINGQILNQEATNQGSMSFGDNSTGIYAVNGASAENQGVITLKDNSAAIYGKGTGTGVSNINKISIGNNSAGLFLEDGRGVVNDGEIKSSGNKTVGIYSVNINNSSVSNTGEIILTGNKNIGIYAIGTGAQAISNTGIIQVGDSQNDNDPGVGIYSNSSSNIINNTGDIISGKNSIGIYNNGGQINQSAGKVQIGDSGIGMYSDSGNVSLSGGILEFTGTDTVGIVGTNNAVIDNNIQLNIGNGNYGIILNSGADLINRNSSIAGDQSVLVYSDKGKSVLNESNADLLMTGSNSAGFYMINGGELVNNAAITGNTGDANIGIYNQSGNIINRGNIKIGDSIIIDPLNPYENSYAVGIYGEQVQSINNTGNIEIGRDAVGFYAKELQTEGINTGNITSGSDRAIGIYIENSAVRNTGNITLSGDQSIGIAAERNSTVKNAGIITMNGNDSIGIYANSNSNIVNESSGKIYINGNDSIGVQLSNGATLENYGLIQIASGAINSAEMSTGNPAYTPPSIINAGVIKVNEKFELNGINIVIKADPLSFRVPEINEITVENYELEDMKAGFLLTNTVNITAPSFNLGSNPVGIDPNFTQGTNARVYKFENVFDPTTPDGGPNTGEITIKSGSLTFDAIPVTNANGGVDIWMEKIDYADFTKGAWYDQFAKNIEGNYLNATGKALELYDRLDLITDVNTLRNSLSQLSGDVYANMNQREETIADVLGTSLNLLQDSKNNTKENVKINVIAGKGKLSENTDGVVGYGYETTGVLALREVERTYKHTFGYSLGYLHTNFEFNDGNESEEDADTIQLGVHNKYRSNDWILKNDLLGRVSIHNIDRNISWSDTKRSEINGKYEAYSITSDNKFGRELKAGKYAEVVPYGGVEALYMTRPTFAEDGSEALKVKGNDAWSIKPKAGIELKTSVPLGEKREWKLKGTLDIAYSYELGDLNEREYARLVNIENDYHKLSKPEEEKGKIVTKAVLGAEVEDRYGIFVTGEYKSGNGSNEEYRAGITLKAVF